MLADRWSKRLEKVAASQPRPIRDKKSWCWYWAAADSGDGDARGVGMAVWLFTYTPPLLRRLRPPAFVPLFCPAALCGGIEKRVGCRATGAVPPQCPRRRRPLHRRASDRVRPSTIYATRDTPPVHAPASPPCERCDVLVARAGGIAADGFTPPCPL